MLFDSDRDARHNISYSSMSNCREGALTYANAGEVNAILTLEKNRITNNCEKLYGNFTTCKSSIWLDLQNTQSLYFKVLFHFHQNIIHYQKYDWDERNSINLKNFLLVEQFGTLQPRWTFGSSRFSRHCNFPKSFGF